MSTLSELRRLLDQATPGPWSIESICYQTTYVAGNRELLPGQGRRFASVAEEPGVNRRERHIWLRDAALIVALRNDADALLDVVEAVDATHVTDTDHDDWYAVKGDDWDAVQAALARLDGKETP